MHCSSLWLLATVITANADISQYVCYIAECLAFSCPVSCCALHTSWCTQSLVSVPAANASDRIISYFRLWCTSVCHHRPSDILLMSCPQGKHTLVPLRSRERETVVNVSTSQTTGHMGPVWQKTNSLPTERRTLKTPTLSIWWLLMVCFRGHSTDRVTAKLSTSVIRLRPLSCFISISSGLFQSELVLLTDSLPVNVHTFPDNGDAWSAEVCTTKLGNVVSMNESSSSSSPKGGCSVTC